MNLIKISILALLMSKITVNCGGGRFRLFRIQHLVDLSLEVQRDSFIEISFYFQLSDSYQKKHPNYDFRIEAYGNGNSNPLVLKEVTNNITYGQAIKISVPKSSDNSTCLLEKLKDRRYKDLQRFSLEENISVDKIFYSLENGSPITVTNTKGGLSPSDNAEKPEFVIIPSGGKKMNNFFIEGIKKHLATCVDKNVDCFDIDLVPEMKEIDFKQGWEQYKVYQSRRVLI